VVRPDDASLSWPGATPPPGAARHLVRAGLGRSGWRRARARLSSAVRTGFGASGGTSSSATTGASRPAVVVACAGAARGERRQARGRVAGLWRARHRRVALGSPPAATMRA
jgi:hypothetical protein